MPSQWERLFGNLITRQTEPPVWPYNGLAAYHRTISDDLPLCIWLGTIRSLYSRLAFSFGSLVLQSCHSATASRARHTACRLPAKRREEVRKSSYTTILSHSHSPPTRHLYTDSTTVCFSLSLLQRRQLYSRALTFLFVLFTCIWRESGEDCPVFFSTANWLWVMSYLAERGWVLRVRCLVNCELPAELRAELAAKLAAIAW